MDVRLEHLEKVPSSIVVILFEMFMDDSWVHPKNARFPIDLTLFGIVMEVKLEHSKNAYVPMKVTPSVISTIRIFDPRLIFSIRLFLYSNAMCSNL